MTLNDLLKGKGIDPRQVVVMRHRPTESKLNRVMPWLAGERPDLFNAYQQTQKEKAERILQRVMYVASFLGRAPRKALFVGLYTVEGWKTLTTSECFERSDINELVALGMNDKSVFKRAEVLWFDLVLDAGFYTDWRGKLIVEWPPPERSWLRRAHRNDIRVAAIREESAFDAAMPAWNEMVFSWDDLGVLPSRWRSVISQWRGIYLIFDAFDGKGYIGSASGADNILGRWTGYAATGHGGNVLLRGRDPKHFRFSILQRVSPDMETADVVKLENTWKKRLHTRKPAGLNDN